MGLWAIGICLAGLGLGKKDPAPQNPPPESPPADGAPADGAPAEPAPAEPAPAEPAPASSLGLSRPPATPTAAPTIPPPTVTGTVSGTLGGTAGAPAIPELLGMPVAVAQQLWAMEVRRAPVSEFAPFLQHADPDVRARAAMALGRLPDGTGRPPSSELLKLLDKAAQDDQVAVRQAAVTALGLTPGSGPTLMARWKTETDPETRRLLLWGLGRTGDREAVPVALAALSGPMAAEAAVALGRMGTRKLDGAQTEPVAVALLQLLNFPVGTARLHAAWAISRLNVKELSAATRERLWQGVRRDPDPLVRAWLLKAWAAPAPAADRARMLAEAAGDEAPGVRIAVARALGRYGCEGSPDALLPLLNDPEVAVRVEADAAAGAAATGACVGPVDGMTARLEAAPPEEAAALIHALVRLKAMPDAGLNAWLNGWAVSARPLQVRMAAIEELKDVGRLQYMAIHETVPAIRSTAATTLLALKPPTEDVLALLGAGDEVVVEIAADAFADAPDARAEPLLLGVLRRPSPPPPTVAACLRALGKLYLSGKLKTPSAEAAPLVKGWLSRFPALAADAAPLLGLLRITAPPVPAPDLPDLAEILHIRSARIQTAHGEIRVELFPEVAPLTVWNFARLAEQGFYDGISFHRVVPDFVIQAGDPRGDGMGGPGYAIPDELSPEPYRTGTLGMALSGPDTGGSQWFITLTPQPHLDGEYSVFGRLTLGRQTTSAIRQGDTISGIRIERI